MSDDPSGGGSGHPTEPLHLGPRTVAMGAGNTGHAEQAGSEQPRPKKSRWSGFLSAPVHRRVPLRRSTVLMVAAFVGCVVLSALYPPSTAILPGTTGSTGINVIPVTTTTTTSTTTVPPTTTTTTVASRPAPTTTSPTSPPTTSATGSESTGSSSTTTTSVRTGSTTTSVPPTSTTSTTGGAGAGSTSTTR